MSGLGLDCLRVRVQVGFMSIRCIAACILGSATSLRVKVVVSNIVALMNNHMVTGNWLRGPVNATATATPTPCPAVSIVEDQSIAARIAIRVWSI